MAIHSVNERVIQVLLSVSFWCEVLNPDSSARTCDNLRSAFLKNWHIQSKSRLIRYKVDGVLTLANNDR